MKCRRGVSEIVSAMIIIAVVVSGLGLYVGLSQQRILGETQSVQDTMKSAEDQLTELVEQIGMLKNSSKIHIFVYNYGLKNITISNVFVNGTINMADSQDATYYVRSLTGANLSKIIPSEKASEIILNFTNDSNPPQHIHNIVIRTNSDKLIEIRNNTN